MKPMTPPRNGTLATPRPPRVTSVRDTYRLSPPSHTLDDWQQYRVASSNADLRFPIVHAAQRIRLASQRCQELSEQIDDLATRLLNVPPHVSQSDVHAVEESKRRLEDRLHHERLALWKDLQPLAEHARDAAVDSMRIVWINELMRTIHGGDAQ